MKNKSVLLAATMAMESPLVQVRGQRVYFFLARVISLVGIFVHLLITANNMRMLRAFNALSYQIAQMKLTCKMFHLAPKARNYRILYVSCIIIHLSIS